MSNQDDFELPRDFTLYPYKAFTNPEMIIGAVFD